MKNNLYTLDNPMPPLWLIFPELPQGSMGWRMGYGESYGIEFWKWFEGLSIDEKQKFVPMFELQKAPPLRRL